MTFEQRAITVEVRLGNGQLGDDPGDPIVLDGLRVQMAVHRAGGGEQGALQMRIFGVPLSLMNRLTTIGPINTQQRKNIVRVTAGERGEPLTLVYEGTITMAWAELNHLPDAALNIVGQGAALAAAKSVPPRTFQGPIDVAVILQQIAQAEGFVFENNGVSVILPTTYLHGSPLEQIRAAANAAEIECDIDRGVLRIWPRAGALGAEPEVISPATGMVGYPTYSSAGLIVRTLFNPRLNLGSRVRIESDLTPANGTWAVFAVLHELGSETVNAPWFTTIQAAPPIEDAKP